MLFRFCSFCYNGNIEIAGLSFRYHGIDSANDALMMMLPSLRA
jgi:hypothetical protein